MTILGKSGEPVAPSSTASTSRRSRRPQASRPCTASRRRRTRAARTPADSSSRPPVTRGPRRSSSPRSSAWRTRRRPSPGPSSSPGSRRWSMPCASTIRHESRSTGQTRPARRRSPTSSRRSCASEAATWSGRRSTASTARARRDTRGAPTPPRATTSTRSTMTQCAPRCSTHSDLRATVDTGRRSSTIGTDRPVAAPVERLPDRPCSSSTVCSSSGPSYATGSISRLRRGVVRGGPAPCARAGRPLLGSRDEVERRYRTRYIPGQRLYVADARPDATADVLVRNDGPAAPVLERVGGRALSPETGRPAR